MIYSLAIDVGSNSISAAVTDWGPEGRRQVRPVRLGRYATVAPNVVFVADSGGLVVGEEAESQGLADPGRLIRGYKHRVGDPVPLRVGKHRYPAERILATVTSWARNKVISQEGSKPASLAVSVPPDWGEHRISLFLHALAEAGVDDATPVRETEAVFSFLASKNDISAGTFALFDLGGEFRATVLQATSDGSHKLLGREKSADPIGSSDFDDAVLRHVVSNVGVVFPTHNSTGSPDPQAFAEVRRRCTLAKEILSTDPATTIVLSLPESQQQVRLTRGEFEDSIRELVNESITRLLRTVDRAGVRHEDLVAIMLTGGSSRVPLIAQMVAERTNRPVIVDADSHTAVACGAALTAASADALKRTTDEVSPEHAAKPTPPPITNAGGARRRAKRRPGSTAKSGITLPRFSGRIAAAATVAVLAAFTLTGAQGPAGRLASALYVQGGDTPRFPVAQAQLNGPTTEAGLDVAASGDGTPPEVPPDGPATFPDQVPGPPPPSEFPLNPGSEPPADDNDTSFAPLMPAGTDDAGTTTPQAETPEGSQGQSAAPQPGDSASVAPSAPVVAPESPSTPAPVETVTPIEPLPTETFPVESPQEVPSSVPALPQEVPTLEAVE